METFSALLAIYAGNSPVAGEFPAQKPVTRSFDVFFDLRPLWRSHYDVIIMIWAIGAISVLRNDRKCKHVHMFPNSVR